MEKDVTSLLFIFSRFPQRGAPFPEVLQDKVCPWSEQVKVTSESEVAQSCPTLCDPMVCSLPGSSVHGILQARVLEWVAVSFSGRSSQPRD